LEETAETPCGDDGLRHRRQAYRDAFPREGGALTSLSILLDEGVRGHIFPGAAFAVGNARDTWFGFAGRQTYDPASCPVNERTLWDLASVSKAVGTTSAAILLTGDGVLSLDAPVQGACPQFGGAEITVRDLLLHRSGLPPYIDATDLHDRRELWQRICRLGPAYERDTASVYSCVGFIVLQHVLERIAECPLDEFLHTRVFEPLGMTRTTYNPGADLRPACAPTQRLPAWQRDLENRRGLVRVQEEFVQGDVHDPLACVMGGVSGNAGLFSTPSDLAVFLRALLEGSFVFASDARIAWTKQARADSSRAIGWDTKSPEGSSAGSLFSPGSFGHTGYTGTSVWVDPQNKLFVALLTNRVHPDDDGMEIASFRPRFHDEAFRFLTGV
jgi:CubicO group peptidase (beta-lactamase class C family)